MGSDAGGSRAFKDIAQTSDARPPLNTENEISCGIGASGFEPLTPTVSR